MSLLSPCNILGGGTPASPPAAGATSALGRDSWQSAFLMPLFQSGFLGRMGGIQHLAGNCMGAMASRKGRVSVTEWQVSN